jgi:CelD/BcsL family acetyltransferase involved in cellulose biosynthesis
MPGSGASCLVGTSLTIFTSLAESEPAWRAALESSAGFVFQTFEWHATWQATIGTAEGVAPHIVRLADAGGRTLMLLPLGIYRQGRLRELRFLGGLVTDYNAPLIDREFAATLGPSEMAVLWADILGRLPRVDLVRLRRMPETIEDVPNPLITLAGASHTENGHAATLPATIAEFRAGRSTRLFRDNRRKRRRLAEQAPLAFLRPAEPELVEEVFSALARQKSRRWRETGQRDWFAEPGYRNFYRSLTDILLPRGRVDLTALRVGDEIVATKWGTVFRGRYCELIGGYEEGEWARLSVGRLLIESVIEWCIETGEVAVYDLTVGEEAYKQSWTDHSIRLFAYMAPCSLRGRAIVAAHNLKERLRRNRRLRALVRRLRRQAPE